MSKGMEMMVQSLIKMLGLDPAQMLAAIEDIRKSLHSAATDMATIRRQNQAIMSHLGIAEPVSGELSNGRAREFGDGEQQAH
jgi:hypothetical protein